MAKIIVDGGEFVAEVQDLDRLRAIARRLDALEEEDGAMDAEDVLTLAEEADATDPVG